MQRRSTALAIALALGAAGPAGAQKVELTPFAGFQFGGGLDTYSGQFDLGNTLNYGAALGAMIRPGKIIEFTWSRQDTDAKIEAVPSDLPLFDVAVSYWHLGGQYQVPVQSGRVQVFTLGSLGATQLDPDASSVDSEWRFSLAAGGGVKIPVNPRVSIRLQGRAWFTFFDTSGSIFVGGGGTSVSVSGNVMVQGEFGGGIAIALR
jgi:opacity protein-like surface antigen